MAKALSILKRLSREEPSITDLFDILTGEHDDRTAAIMGAARVEHALEKRIISFLRPLNNDRRKRMFEGEGLLSSFSAKIQLGFALSIFDQAFANELNRVKEIRNAFAHARKPITFKRKAVSDVCKSLRLPTIYPRDDGGPRTARSKFDLTVSMLVVAFTDAQPLDASWNRKELSLETT